MSPTGGDGPVWKLDLTAGLNLNDRAVADPPASEQPRIDGDWQVRFAPSVVQRLNDLLQVELGAEAEALPPHDLGLKLALWLEF